MLLRNDYTKALEKKKRRYHKHGRSGLDSAINNLASKIGSLLKKTCRSSKLEYHDYQRLVESRHDQADDARTIDKSPGMYVPVYVDKEAKSIQAMDILLELWSFERD
ncbi:hypothetical protein QUC31_017124 [Theobroma cacao]|nr:hypothetical protein QQP08_013754 [Theobroma cacao]